MYNFDIVGQVSGRGSIIRQKFSDESRGAIFEALLKSHHLIIIITAAVKCPVEKDQAKASAAKSDNLSIGILKMSTLFPARSSTSKENASAPFGKQ
jgi:hypothetical protein